MIAQYPHIRRTPCSVCLGRSLKPHYLPHFRPRKSSRIKAVGFQEALKQIGTGPDDTPITQPFVADLLVTYAFDIGSGYQMVRPMDLKPLGLSADDLPELAATNLRKMAGRTGFTGEPPVLRVVAENTDAAVLLLLSDIWDELTTKVPKEMVVGVPSRDLILVTSTASTKGGMQLIRQMVDQAHAAEQVHGLTRHLLAWRNGNWELWES